MSKEQIHVAAIVANFNGESVIEECLDALFASEFSNVNLVVYFLDNCSEDRSVEVVKQGYANQINEGRLKVFLNNSNINCGPNYSLGFLVALEEFDYDYVLKVDNDFVYEPDGIQTLVNCLESNSLADVAGATVHLARLPGKIQGVGSHMVEFLGIPLYIKSYLKFGDATKVASFPETMEVDLINGCTMLIRSQVIRNLGAYDNLYVVNAEDFDFMLRVRRNDRKILYCRDAVGKHYVGVSAGNQPGHRLMTRFRNFIILMFRYYGWRGFFYYQFYLSIIMLRNLIQGNRLAPMLEGFKEGISYVLGHRAELKGSAGKKVHYPDDFLSIAVPLQGS